jgi:DNA-binding NarL/FixJ family response regulator
MRVTAHLMQGVAMSLSVVVVDDTLEFRAIGRSTMATASETMTLVGEAADGEEALALILGERRAVVITDILMPRMNGIELLTLAVAHGRRARIGPDCVRAGGLAARALDE